MISAFTPPEIAITDVAREIDRAFTDAEANRSSVVLTMVRSLSDEPMRFVELRSIGADYHGPPFESLAVNNPARLITLIERGRLADHDLTFAAEALGRVADASAAIAVLRKLTHHDSPVVREGAVYGLSRHVRSYPDARSAVATLASNDSSPGVRAAAIEALDP